jgi:hypothetical protein
LQLHADSFLRASVNRKLPVEWRPGEDLNL